MPEEISSLQSPAGEGVYSGIWIEPKEELPEEGEPVLLLLDDYSMGFGCLMNATWEIVLPPWEQALNGEEEVIYWTKYPRYP